MVGLYNLTSISLRLIHTRQPFVLFEKQSAGAAYWSGVHLWHLYQGKVHKFKVFSSIKSFTLFLSPLRSCFISCLPLLYLHFHGGTWFTTHSPTRMDPLIFNLLIRPCYSKATVNSMRSEMAGCLKILAQCLVHRKSSGYFVNEPMLSPHPQDPLTQGGKETWP